MSLPLEGIRVAITENRYPEQLSQLLERLGASVLPCPFLRKPRSKMQRALDVSFLFARTPRLTTSSFIPAWAWTSCFAPSTNPKSWLDRRSWQEGQSGKCAEAGRPRTRFRCGFGDDRRHPSDAFTGALEWQSHSRAALRAGKPRTRTALQKRGATVIGVSIYNYSEASDKGAVESLIKKILTKEIGAIAFTSATQVPFLFRAVEELGKSGAIRKRLKKDVVVASVGEVTSRALRKRELSLTLNPKNPKWDKWSRLLRNSSRRGSAKCSIRCSWICAKGRFWSSAEGRWRSEKWNPLLRRVPP